MREKPFNKTKSIVTYVVCGVLIVALAIGNYYASLYKDLITVYTSGSDVVTTDESAKVCQTIEEEGMVLLKNENGLPLKEGAKVSLFGEDSVDFVYGGSGSGSVDTSLALNLKQAMEASGFEVNDTLWDFYDKGAGKDYRKSVPDETGEGEFAVNEVPANVYTDDVKESFKDYNDAAVVCIGRSGGESADIPTEPLASGYQYLELDQDERDLLTMACENFDNVVVLVNANNAMELGFLNEDAYKNVKACVWVGGVGQEGIKAVADALAGKTNFSGHLADTYAYDSLSAPSAENLGDYTITNSDVKNGNKYLVYSEGIYVGYRYYETRYEDAVMGTGNAGDYDYTSTVQFPFGYGLSYTDFKWSDYTVEEKENTYEVTVTVKNTGDVAGKDVVEVYMQSPYTDYDKENGIEKSAVELVGFTKTDEIEPGKEQTVTVSVDKEVMKAYDAKNAKTYIVDAGDYYFTAASDAHEALNNILAAKGYTTENGMDADGNAEMTYKATVGSLDNTTYAKSTETGNDVTNQFDDVDIRYYDDSFTYLTRNDWTGSFPTTYANGSMTATDALLADLKWNRSGGVANDGSKMPEFEQDGDQKVSDAKDAAYDDEIWAELVSKLSADKAMQLVRQGGYATIQADVIGLPATTDKDGTSGISGTLVGGQSAMAYPVEAVMACTWNMELLYQLGLSLGEDSVNTEVAGWYAPGVDIHRSPYSGRNFEYFSEDGFLSGQLAGNEVKGAREKGVITYMKHFALNDQETNRYGGAMFANEQSIRELYLKGFEYTVTIGKTNAAMAGMNRIGARWVGAHKGLMTNVLRGEWGFAGMVITDQASVSAMFYQDIISGLSAGTDLWLNTNKSFWKLDEYAEEDGTVVDWTKDATVMNNVARAAKNVIYAVGTSNAMDSVSDDGTVVAKKAPWEIALIILDIIVFGICGLLIILTSIRWAKYAKSLPMQEEEGDDIVKKNKVVVLVIIAVLVGLLAGGLGTKLLGGAKSSGDAKSAASTDASATNGGVYIYGEDKDNSYGGTDYDEYQLTLNEDGTYEMTMTEATYAFDMLLAHTSVTTYGTYEKGDSSDGATACKLSEANRIIYNSYSDVGGYNLSYDTDTVSEYPVELPGGIMTEKEDFFNQCGPQRTVYLDDANPSRMSFTQE
ncbi:MAG: glycoside hydrolase family 3 N-terminal domain-containing protein [Lachnospiraceae bacterium]|nr:glycoside hydrolase family 3 N-terminal domain-containing protein [Lachnospiraceae bacterium]